MRRLIRSASACLLVLTGVMLTPLAQPRSVLALDETVTTCDWDTFSQAVDDVQSSNGGTITFACSGTILFSSQKVITSHVTIVGGGNVTFDGQDMTRFFRLIPGSSLSLVGLTLQNGNAVATPSGGAISNEGGTLTVTACTFSDNRTDNSGGAIFTINSATVIASTFTGNTSNANGGAIYNAGRLTITGSTFSSNTSAGGGAIHNIVDLTVAESTFSGNASTNFGGAIQNTGMQVTATVMSSTFSSNSAAFSGGAIYSEGSVLVTVAVTASTFSGNVASLSGGAIFSNGASVTMTVTASTFSGNLATLAGGAIFSNDASATLQSTILANSPIGLNCSGSITSNGYNLSDDGSCVGGTGDIPNSTSINLGALQDNGGATNTMLPLPGSDAISAIPNADCLTYSSSTDQRGLPRPQGECEIGAVELGLEPTIVPSPSEEGRSVSLNSSFFAPGEPAGFRCQLGWGDGVSEFGGVAVDNGIGTCTGNHVYADNGTYSVTVEVCDGAECNNGSTDHTVTNVAPTITGIGASPVAEGSPTTITVTATDPAGVNDPLQYEFDCNNDAVYEVGPQSSNSTDCTFADSGSFTVGVRVSDDDGGAAASATSITVSNVAPTVNTPSVNPSPSNEGDAVSASATFSDPGTLDTHKCSVDYDDGSGPQAGTVTGNTCTGPAYTYVDDDPTGTPSDPYTVTVAVTDDENDSGDNSVAHTVTNVAPTITEVSNAGPVDEGSPVAVTVTATDAGTADSLSFAFDCGNDGTYEIGPQTANSLSCTFDENGAYTIPVRVTDDDTGVSTASTVVTVANAAPAVDAPTVDIEPSDEGESVVASASFSDPGALDTHMCTVDYGDGSGTLAGTVMGATCTGPAHIYLDDAPTGTASDDYTVTIEVTDDEGDSGSNDALHMVNNVSPVINNIATNGPVPQGQPVTVSVDATDVGINDTLTYSFDCDDDGVYELGPQASNHVQCPLDPSVATTTINVEVSDGDDGMTIGSVMVGQVVTLCVNTYTRALSGGLGADGACLAGGVLLSLPQPQPVTLCINRSTAAILWSPSGACNPDQQKHLVPDSGPLNYCENLYTHRLRYTLSGACPGGERAGVIPG